MARRRRAPRPGALGAMEPLRILSQIVVLQFCYFGIAVVLIVFTTLTAGQHPNPALFLDWRSVRGDVATGWTLGLCWMLDSLITVIPILLLIARSKLVPDFALTIHFIQLVITTLYTRSIPTSISWWALQCVSSALMISLGMWACQWRELQPMAFGGAAKRPAGDDEAAIGSSAESDGQAGSSTLMGILRGNKAGDRGAYELVGMAPKDKR